MKGFNRSIDLILLREAGIGNERAAAEFFAGGLASGNRLDRALVEKGLLSEERVLAILEKELGIARVDLNRCAVDPLALSAIPADLALRHGVMPIAISDEFLSLAVSDPLDLKAIDEAAMISGREVKPLLAKESVLKHLIAQAYSLKKSQAAVSPGPEALGAPSGPGNPASAIVEEAPVIRIVNALIERAAGEGASDIHLEPGEEGLRVRLRLDGVLHDITPPPSHTGANIVARIKIMANLDIAEKRLPQDGRFHWQNGNRAIDLRVSTLPTVHGEKVVIRLLEKEKILLPLDLLGFSAENYRTLLRLLLNQHGLILVTGPTGCGKTTTLYSALHYLNRPEENIVTVEDPVEFRLKGINQVQVNPRINRTFAGALRSILRQDPNIIMVGEIRDIETVKVAIQAALTGHLVLSTLHTNNAAGAVTRLVDMGLETYLVPAALVGVVAQRLIRKICVHCSREYRPNSEERLFFSSYFGREAPVKLLRGSGCAECGYTGYRGRIPIAEIMVLDRELQNLVMEGATAERIHKKALDLGMRPLASDGLRFVLGGTTTVGEVVRATFSSIVENLETAGPGHLEVLARMHRDLP